MLNKIATVNTTVKKFFNWYTDGEFLSSSFWYYVLEFITPDLVEDFGSNEVNAAYALADVLKSIKNDKIEVEVGEEVNGHSDCYYAKFTIGDGVQLDKFDLCIYTANPFVND